MSKVKNKTSSSVEDTPMMQQYMSIKGEHPDSILFFRMGDFYEMFFEDAKKAASILEIALTSRNKNKEQPIPMCGIPHHSSALYIAKLIKKGQSIAICEQVEDPKQTKGIVKREVVRVITPGTVLEDHLLDPKNNHYLVSIYQDEKGTGLASVDISTGHFQVTQIEGKDALHLLQDELARMEPREIICPESLLPSNGNGMSTLSTLCENWRPRESWTFHAAQAKRSLLEHFKTQSLDGFGCSHLPLAICAAGGLIHYLIETQKTTLQHINRISTVHLDDFMLLDEATVHSLELVRSSNGERKHSLLGLLDQTLTPMGARTVREWILKPLVHCEQVESRLDKVGLFTENPMLRQEIREHLSGVLDLERLLARISLVTCNPRELVSLKTSVARFPLLQQTLDSVSSPVLKSFLDHWDNLQEVHDIIDRFIVDDPPLASKGGHIIKEGQDPELDRLKTVSRTGNQEIAALESRERERTRITQLKVGYNKIYGYFLEVTKKNLDRVPDDYIRKQSLVNAERFICPELKKLEEDISGAEEKIKEMEQVLFQKVREQISAEGRRIQDMTRIISQLDALAGFAELSHRSGYNRPQMNNDDRLIIENGRHPLVESIDPSQNFTPNDCHLDCQDHQVIIITGPNMAGKSTYLRQIALIALMAQIGCFVPADAAKVGLVDRIFSRVGAQDHLVRGQSTFMVEMNETANILNNATSRSLIILDEIGRGTSTFDGLSLAWAIVEYLHGSDGLGARTLFATHYHELTELAILHQGVQNRQVQVKEWNDEIIFLHKIAEGGADRSYGIQVARLAGLPESVLQRAREILGNHENNEFDAAGFPKRGLKERPHEEIPQQLGLFQESASPLVKAIQEVDPDSLTPREALDKLYELTRLIKMDKP
ncbi:MAG: DNA mismatch repair protein MutS [Candidatus Nitronauta litoralis]|uniref:DNA mismatch repair protein MutS n=1 Tax=Candidatus Nitronauta litoralis TaxID=2705533 RepID=A0A7T0G1B0_9BACT|nr:MAG: DNA mismatch repair protein MutS [Candidatus Nitronauta litoralis]